MKFHLNQFSPHHPEEAASSSESSPTSKSSLSSFVRRQTASTSSLPINKVISGVHRNRLSQSFQRIRRRTKAVVDVEESPPHSNSVHYLPEEYKELNRSHADFEHFLTAVISDLEDKIEKLRRFKLAVDTSAHDKNFANLQVS